MSARRPPGSSACLRTLHAPILASELWLYPRDSRVALNGSGLLIVNPPYQCWSACSAWLPQLDGGAVRRSRPRAAARFMLAESRA